MVAGMSTACFFPKVYNEDAIDVIGKMGVRRIEIFFCCIAEYRQDFIRDLKRRADFWGIEVGSVHAYSLQFEPQLFSSHGRARGEALDVYLSVLEAAAYLGAKTYVFHGPPNLKHARDPVPDYGYVAEKTQPLADLARRHGVSLSWENVHWCWFSTPAFAQRLLPLLDADSLSFTFDLKQAVQSGFSPEAYLQAMRGRLNNVHICDVRIDERGGHAPVLPFHGSVDFESLKLQLHNIGYDGPVILEVYSSNYADHQALLDNYLRVRRFFDG